MPSLLRSLLGFVASVWVLSVQLQAQGAYVLCHETEQWDKLPTGMIFGPLTGGFPDPDGRHIPLCQYR